MGTIAATLALAPALAAAVAPRHTHDCDKCTFLGHADVEGQTRDVYVCAQGGLGVTLISRYSSDGPDYASYPEFMVNGLRGAGAGPETVLAVRAFDAWVAAGRPA